jgi:Xaa-Pro dipeptidase
MNKRLEALSRLQAANRLDCVALVPGANLRYFTGLEMQLSERPTVAFFPAGKPPAVLLPELEAPAARLRLGDQVRLLTYRDEQGHADAFFQVSEELELAGSVIGVEFLGMRLLEMRRIEQAAPRSRFVATEPWLPQLRMTKDAEEIAFMRRAVHIAERALHSLLDEGAIRSGRTEREVAADLQVALLRQGSQGLPFMPIVVAGPNAAQPHAGPSDRQLQATDPVIIDWGAVFQGYQSDLTRTFVLGEPAVLIRQAYDAVLAANQAGRMAVRPGAAAQEVDRAARRAISLAGFGEYFIHRTGHGLGLETHEPPYLVEGNSESLPAGAAFTVEPGVYISGVGGVRIEDDVVVTVDGSETLSTLPRELVVL